MMAHPAVDMETSRVLKRSRIGCGIDHTGGLREGGAEPGVIGPLAPLCDRLAVVHRDAVASLDRYIPVLGADDSIDELPDCADQAADVVLGKTDREVGVAASGEQTGSLRTAENRVETHHARGHDALPTRQPGVPPLSLPR